jgi:hypothetical protein
VFGQQQAKELKNTYGDVINYQCIDQNFMITSPREAIGLKVSQIAAG